MTMTNINSSKASEDCCQASGVTEERERESLGVSPECKRDAMLSAELNTRINALSFEITSCEEEIQNLNVQIASLMNDLNHSDNLDPSLKKQISAKILRLQDELTEASRRAVVFKSELSMSKSALHKLLIT